MCKLGTKDQWIGVKNKPDLLRELCNNRDFTLEEVVYAGCDINELECLKIVALGFYSAVGK